MLTAALAAIAIVTQDQTALRAAPRDSAPQQTVLWQGDTLEVRGQQFGFLQVYDHRRERGGYVRASQVRTSNLQAADAPGLLAVVHFLTDTPGQEALGMAYAAAYIKAAPAEAIGADVFDALGTMADRLGRRASQRQARPDDAATAAHLDVAASLGVTMVSVEQDGRMQLCYDGVAFRRVLALPASAEQQAHAALALTRPECSDPNLRPVERFNLDTWRARVLDLVDTGNLPDYEKNRIRLRQAGVWASLAYEHTRRGEPAQESAERAINALAGVNNVQLAEEDNTAYNEAAIRVGASRWAAAPIPAASHGLTISLSPGQPGETCVALMDTRKAVGKQPAMPLVQRCTYGLVWTGSTSVNAMGTALALAVQPLEGWRELWMFHQTALGWSADVLPPSQDNPDLGYLEFAGWVPGGKQLLAVSEVKTAGHYQRKFQVIKLDTLAVQKQADRPESLSAFNRWQDPLWKQQTVSVR